MQSDTQEQSQSFLQGFLCVVFFLEGVVGFFSYFFFHILIMTCSKVDDSPARSVVISQEVNNQEQSVPVLSCQNVFVPIRFWDHGVQKGR